MYMSQTKGLHNILVIFHTVSFILLLSVSPVAASIGRTQSFVIGAPNRIDWGGGIGSARQDRDASFSQAQHASSHYGNVSISQAQRGTLTQTATATGLDPSSVRQTARIRGTQDLVAGTPCAPGSQAHQDLSLKMVTRLVQPGVGSTSGTQTYSGVQEQSSVSPWGTGSQSQSVDVRQSGSITTGTNIDPTVKNTITINLHQSQMTEGR